MGLDLYIMILILEFQAKILDNKILAQITFDVHYQNRILIVFDNRISVYVVGNPLDTEKDKQKIVNTEQLWHTSLTELD